MNRQGWAILCIAYIAGLLSTGFLGSFAEAIALPKWLGLSLAWLVLGGIVGAIVPRFWRKGPRLPIWIAAGLVAGLAIAHLQLRVPQPANNDISFWVEKNLEQVTVTGTIRDRPSFNRSEKLRFILAVEAANGEPVSGKLYVTIPPPERELVPRQNITVQGRLYAPQRAKNPGAFDFKAYLAPQGVFAGLAGEFVTASEEQPWGWWQLRQRITLIHSAGLGEDLGALVSSMVMGRRAIDLPFILRDLFIQAGLAHILAASGFHVSLLLGGVLALTGRLEEKYRFAIGVVILMAYMGLTGLQPSILRAVFMGIAVLFAMTVEKKVNPLGALLLVATVLLLGNPLWIGNLSFQLSFLATMGLVISVPAITKKLDWLPPTIATIIAVPVAATLWTLPLTAHYFNVLATYSILVNILTAHLGSFIILGGMASGFIGLIVPALGSAIAWLLLYPTSWLVSILRFFVNLPGSSFAVGHLTVFQLIGIYGIIGAVCYWKSLQKWWWGMGLIAAFIAIAPLAYAHTTLARVTVLATGGEQVIVLQDRGKVTLIDAGDEDTATYTVLPFLAHEGINHIDLAVSLKNYRELGWKPIFDNLAVKTFLHAVPTFEAGEEETLAERVQPFAVGQTVTMGEAMVTRLHPAIAQLKFGDRPWLLLYAPTEAILPTDLSAQMLLFAGNSVHEKVLGAFGGKTAIASSGYVASETFQTLRQKGVYIYITGRHGAIQWTARQGFTTMLDS